MGRAISAKYKVGAISAISAILFTFCFLLFALESIVLFALESLHSIVLFVLESIAICTLQATLVLDHIIVSCTTLQLPLTVYSENIARIANAVQCHS